VGQAPVLLEGGADLVGRVQRTVPTSDVLPATSGPSVRGGTVWRWTPYGRLLLPEVLVAHVLDGEPQRPVPRVVGRLHAGQHVAGGVRRGWMAGFLRAPQS
jgi:hypothetical protein